MKCRMIQCTGDRFPVTQEQWEEAGRDRKQKLTLCERTADDPGRWVTEGDPEYRHAVGDEIIPLTEHERQQIRDRERLRAKQQPEATTQPATLVDADDVPWPATAPGPAGQQFTVHRSSLVNRLRSLEAWAADVEGVPVSVWQIRHWENPIYGIAVAGQKGAHVLVNDLRTPCAVLRLAVLAHEVEHVRRGDCDSGSPFSRDRYAEAACDAAAERRIEQTAHLIGSSTDKGAPILDADICRQCYHDGGKVCRQQPGVYEQVQDRLSWAAP